MREALIGDIEVTEKELLARVKSKPADGIDPAQVFGWRRAVMRLNGLCAISSPMASHHRRKFDDGC